MVKTFKLNTGDAIPALGLGTWQSSPGEVTNAVYHALKSGYRHIDCALCYQNEDEVGHGLKQAFDEGIVQRKDVFITTKLWSTDHRRVEEGLDKSLSKLGLDYVDLYLIHWPLAMNPAGSHPLFPKHEDGSRDLDLDRKHFQTWQDMEKLPETGKVKAIGVCNYSVKFLKELLPEAKIVPAVNQIENHPLLPQDDLVDFCKDNGIVVTAYSPFGSTGSPLFQDADVVSIAKKHSTTPGAVLLSFPIARGIVTIPKSTNPSRIEENLKIVDLDEEDVKLLLVAHEKRGITRFVYPPFGHNFGFPDKEEFHASQENK